MLYYLSHILQILSKTLALGNRVVELVFVYVKVRETVLVGTAPYLKGHIKSVGNHMSSQEKDYMI